jgi:hypothetical protein
MSFLSTNISEFLSARITQKGRMAIAKGSFNINYFQVGDSEFDYNLIFTELTGKTNHQMVMAPFDKESGIKYPYKIDSSTSGTTYGVPVNNYLAPEPIRNAMGPAGFVTNYIENGTAIKTYPVITGNMSMITGGTILPVICGNTFNDTDTITIAFTTFTGTDPYNPIISGSSTSLIYKIINKPISGNTLELDRELPNLSLIGNGTYQIIKNYGELEYPSYESNCPPIDNLHQQNPWTLDVVWDSLRPIGVNNSGDEYSLDGYESNKHTSSKEFLGYSTTSGQTFFETESGGTITYPTSYKNTYNELINISPEEQRCIAIIHYSELGDLFYSPESFYKYDDYISRKIGITDADISIINDENDIPLSDTEYFQVYIPFINYHRNVGTTLGAVFHMDETDHYIASLIDGSRSRLLFRYLLDEQNNNVGKVFPNNKIVVFDDQELVAILDLRSNRKYTLPAPKMGLVASDVIPEDSLFTGNTGNTMWMTYILSNKVLSENTFSGLPFNGLPCNYYSKVESSSTPSNITFKFSENEFSFLGTDFNSFKNGFMAQNFHVLVQITTTGELPKSDQWRYIDFTGIVGGDNSSFINPTGLTGTTFVITNALYENAVYPFDLDSFMGLNYTSLSTGTTQFGAEQPFPGSIRVVRASDLETLNFLVNLPSTQFTDTQNPTYVSGTDKRITEVALLDTNKEVLIIAKTPIPIKRIGTQVFSLKLDF